MLRLLLSKDWICIRNEILARVSEDVAAQKDGRILLVPELISHDMERRLCAAAGDSASRFAQVLSFPRLTQRVADSMGCPVEDCMDNGGRVVAMAAAARQLHSRLKAYAAVETKPEFLIGLVDAVDEFKRCCISPADLKNASSRTEAAFAQKLEELSLLLEGYDSICANGKRDPRDQMNWLLEQLEDGDFSENHVFYIDGFPDFTRQHMAILDNLIRLSPCVTVGLNCDKVDSASLAFEKAADTASQLIRCAKRAGIPVEIEVLPGREDGITKISGALFQGKLPEGEGLSQNLTVRRTDSLWQEVSCAARQVMDLVRDGYRYRDISLVCSDMGQYADVLKLVFDRCNIPLYLSGTEDILQKTVVATVLSALDAALDGFEQRSVLRYLKSCLSPLEPDACDLVENYVILWGIRGKQWLQPWEKHPVGLGEEWTPEATALLKLLNSYRSLAIKPLEDLYTHFQNAKNLQQQVQALYGFLEDIRLAQRMDILAQKLDEEGDNRGAQILNQLWEILLSALEQMHDVLGQTVWEPEVFIRLLTLLLGQYDVGTIPPVLDAVMAGPVSAMRCQQTKHLIVLGAEEGALPGYGGSTGVLTDQERVALRELDIPLTGGAQEGLQAEFAEIYGVFCGAEETVTVSCCGSQPSYIYSRLQKMAGGEVRGVSGPVIAAADPRETAYWLNRWQEKAAAEALGLQEQYADAQKRLTHDWGTISRENIRTLYGEKLNLSASQIDRQAECRMSYFLKYGLRAKERKEATVDPAEFGTYIHAVLEQTVQKVKELGGFANVSLEQTMELAFSYSDEYAAQRFSQLDSQRSAWLFHRHKQELEMVVAELWKELKDSKFLPEAFELAFGGQGGLSAIDVGTAQMGAVLRGFVDRVDVWQENGQNYFRIVDYKTGKKDFDYCDILCGVGLQMLLYLFALERNGESVLGEHPVAAGVQYFPARAPLISGEGHMTDEEAEQARLKEWKRKGLLLHDEQVLGAMEPTDQPVRLCCTRKKDGSLSGDLADRQQLKMLEMYVFSLLHSMVDEIASGNVGANPYTRGTAHDACSFCPYGAVCRKQTVTERRNFAKVSSQEFWDEVERKVDSHG